jgi:hypothetical protein
VERDPHGAQNQATSRAVAQQIFMGIVSGIPIAADVAHPWCELLCICTTADRQNAVAADIMKKSPKKMRRVPFEKMAGD